MVHMIDVLAKGALAASLAVLGAVAVLTTPAEPPEPTALVEPIPPVDVAVPVNSSNVTRPPTLDAQTQDLRRLESMVEEQQAQTARISGKLYVLLDEGGRNAAARPRRKPLAPH